MQKNILLNLRAKNTSQIKGTSIVGKINPNALHNVSNVKSRAMPGQNEISCEKTTFPCGE